jgi:hypothetical protein
MSSKSKVEVEDLFKKAVQIDGLSQDAAGILVDNLDATTMLGCQGVAIDEIATDDVTLVSMVIDMSGSMASVEQAVIEGFNTMMKAMRDSKQEESILVEAWVFNYEPRLLFGWTPVNKVPFLTSMEYEPKGGTALYDAQLNALTGIVGYGQELRNNGIRTKCIVVVLSDGADNQSKSSAGKVKAVADELIKQEIYILAFAGFESGEAVDFREIAKITGFPSIITVDSTPSEVRRIFGQVSKSAIRISQTSINPDPNSFFGP